MPTPQAPDGALDPADPRAVELAQRVIVAGDAGASVPIKPTDIQEAGIVGGAVTLPGRPAVPTVFPGIPYELAARPDVEYVAGGLYEATLAYARSLPQYIDDLTEREGYDIYERMQRDAQVQGDLNYLKLAVLANGVTLTPAIAEGEAGYRQAKKMCDFCQANLDELDTPLEPYLVEMLDAIATGNKVSETVYRQQGDEYWLYRLKPKPRDVYAYVVDNRQNVIGLLGALAGRARTVVVNASILDPELVPNIIPRGKFAIYTYRPKVSDPRGSSILRAAYDPWYLKQQTYLQWLRYLVQFGGPSLVGKTAQNAMPMPRFDTAGNPLTNPADGSPVHLSPEQAMLAQLTQFQAGSALVVPFGAEVDAIFPQGNGEAFKTAISQFDGQISKAILSQTLTTNEGEHQARAASETAKSGTDLLVDYVEQTLATMLRREILRPLLDLNYGPGVARQYCPLVTLSKVEEIDFPAIATAIASLAKANYLAPTQLAAIDAKLGLPARTPEEAAAYGAPPVLDDADNADPAKFSFLRHRPFSAAERTVLHKLLVQASQ